MSFQTPGIGRIVHYTLSEQDASAVNRRRGDANRNMTEHVECPTGCQLHQGNEVREGDVYPLVITRVWGTDPTSSVNGQVLLDGTDNLWVTSVSVGEGPRRFAWPVVR